jgi:hypothetical protein
VAGSPIKRARHVDRLKEIGIEAILEDVSSGLLYRAIAEKHEVSYAALTDFLYLEENRQLLRSARQAGARAHVEIALEDANNEQDPRMAGLQKLRADMRLHLARADDGETWGERKNVQVSGQLDVQSLHLIAVSRTPRVLPGRAVAPALAAGAAEDQSADADFTIEEEDGHNG